MSKIQQLPLSLLPTVFGVSSVSIYLWRQGTPTKDALVEPFTPARLKAWAKKNGRTIAKEPEAVLAKYEKELARKVGASPSKSKLARTGAGRVTSARAMARS